MLTTVILLKIFAVQYADDSYIIKDICSTVADDSYIIKDICSTVC